ncbi:MAG: S41 family peptidase, partial [Acidobacteriota bacterium]
ALFAVTPPALEAEAPDEARIERLASFAELYGLTRFFHPADEGQLVDWDRLAVVGAERALAAEDTDALRAALTDIFMPVAPTLRIVPTGTDPGPIPNWPELAEGETLDVVAWQHRGFNPGSGSPPYASVRSHRGGELPAAGPGFGVVARRLDAEGYRGMAIRLRGAARFVADDGEGQAQLWLRVDRPKNQRGFFDNMGDRPIKDDTWQVAEIVGDVADDASSIAFGAFLEGTGNAWLDSFEVAVRAADAADDAPWTPVELDNGGFETAGADDAAAEWATPTQGYAYALSDASPHSGERALHIASEPVDEVPTTLFDILPEAGEEVRRSIGSGLDIALPIALWSRDSRTLGGADDIDSGPLFDALDRVTDDVMRSDTLPTRVAAITILWSSLEHFYPYWDVVDTDWHAMLRSGLAGALIASDRAAFGDVLRSLGTALQDGHAFISHPSFFDERGMLPIAVRWLGGEVVVTTSDDEAIQPGDRLVSLDGASAEERFAAEVDRFSGTTQWRNTRAGWELVSGTLGSTAHLVIERRGERIETEIELGPGQRMATSDLDPITELDDGVRYVDLSRAPWDDIQAELDALAAADAVIFDLRGYPNRNHAVLNHLTDETLRSAKWNVPLRVRPAPAPVDGWNTDGRWTMEPAEPRFRGAIAFLTDGSAISYAESVMGIVEHYDLGIIVGTPTAGANGNVNRIPLPGGYRAIFTGMKVLKHDDSQHHRIGILPDVEIEPTRAGLAAGRDEVLERAIELVTAADE